MCLLGLKEQWKLRFPEPKDHEIKALLLDPRIKSKAASIVDDTPPFARVEHELEQEHEHIYNLQKPKNSSTNAPITSERGFDSPQDWFSGSQDASIAIQTLLDIEVPSERSAASRECYKAAALAWSDWKELSLNWSSQPRDGKFNLLGLYKSVDVLDWFRDHGERDNPAIALLARIYLGKPMSTAAQERFFSLSGYVVNDPRTSLDDKRAEILFLMKANWAEYKNLLQRQQLQYITAVSTTVVQYYYIHLLISINLEYAPIGAPALLLGGNTRKQYRS
jgi:hypothetical protein